MSASHPSGGKLDGPLRPADECPFARPFREDFDECPAFEPQPFAAMDMSDRPLAPMLTCGNLVTRSLPHGKAGWYAACRVGDAAARQRLAQGAVR